MKRPRKFFPQFDTETIGQVLEEIRTKRVRKSRVYFANHYNCCTERIYKIETGNFSPYNSAIFMRYAHYLYRSYLSATDLVVSYQGGLFKSNALDPSCIGIEGFIELDRCITALFGSLHGSWSIVSNKAREYGNARVCSDKEFAAFAKSCRANAGETGISAAKILYCTPALVYKFENHGSAHPERSAAIMRYIFKFVIPHIVTEFVHYPARAAGGKWHVVEKYAPFINYISEKVL